MRDIPPAVVEAGLGIASARNALSHFDGRVAYMKSGHESGTFDPIGAVAEAWFYVIYGKPRGWKWNAIDGLKDERDVGPCEIQAAIAPNKNLVVRQKDADKGVPLNTWYVLVQIDNRDGKWKGEFLGKIRLGRALDHEKKWRMPGSRDNENVWLIAPTDLEPMPPEKPENEE